MVAAVQYQQERQTQPQSILTAASGPLPRYTAMGRLASPLAATAPPPSPDVLSCRCSRSTCRDSSAIWRSLRRSAACATSSRPPAAVPSPLPLPPPASRVVAAVVPVAPVARVPPVMFDQPDGESSEPVQGQRQVCHDAFVSHPQRRAAKRCAGSLWYCKRRSILQPCQINFGHLQSPPFFIFWLLTTPHPSTGNQWCSDSACGLCLCLWLCLHLAMVMNRTHAQTPPSCDPRVEAVSARVRSACAAPTGMHAVLLQHNTESLWPAMQAAMPGGNRCKLANHALQTPLHSSDTPALDRRRVNVVGLAPDDESSVIITRLSICVVGISLSPVRCDTMLGLSGRSEWPRSRWAVCRIREGHWCLEESPTDRNRAETARCASYASGEARSGPVSD